MKILDVLKNLSFTEYEAKAYLSLLSNSPATGYAVAKNSGVPRAKVYEVLDNLIKRGDVLVSPSNPPLYRALSPKTLISSRRARAEENFLVAEELLKDLEVPDGGDGNIWNITGRDAIIQKAKDCIKCASKRVLIEIWAEDFVEIAPELEIIAEHDVNITVVSYGSIVANYAKIYLHDMGEAITEEVGGRWIILSVDDSQIVAGIVSAGEQSRAAWSKHPGLVMPITEVIVHDLYIAEMLREHRDILEQTFGKNLINLRKRFAMYPDYRKHYIN